MRRTLLAIVATLCLAPAASAEPKTIALWHVFTLETDMIHGAVKGFNASQTDYRIDARIVAGPQITTELTKAIASGAVPDLVTIDNPIVETIIVRPVRLTIWPVIIEPTPIPAVNGSRSRPVAVADVPCTTRR